MTQAASKPAVQSFPVGQPDWANREWSVDDSYRYCERLTRSHYENFPVGSILIPRPLRRHVCAIYAFARTADDFADEEYGDESYTASERIRQIDDWLEQLKRAYDGRARHPIFLALAATARQFELPISLFQDLLSAFAQDVMVRRYETFADVMDYCRRSANPVGRLILLLFGYRDQQMPAQSDDICSGLQLANHWQDVGIDLDKDRVYLPVEDLDRFGLTVELIRKQGASDDFKRLLAFEVDRAREMFARGKPLCTSVRGRLGLELRAVWLGGMTILKRIEENDYDVFNRRPEIGSADKVKILLTAASKGAFGSFK